MRASWRGGWGDRVKHWVMFNEANIHALFGYGRVGHAPGLKGLVQYDPRQPSSEFGAGLARFSRCAPSGPIWSSARCSTSRRCGRPRTARRITAQSNASMRSGTAPFSIRCSRAVYPEVVAAEFEPAVADGRSENHPPADRFFRAELLCAGLGDGSAAEPVRRLVRRGAGGHSLHRDRLADRRGRIE